MPSLSAHVSATVSGAPSQSRHAHRQATGCARPVLQRPFAHTRVGRSFNWFNRFCGLTEEQVRSSIYFAAVCRCFPGKAPGGTIAFQSEEIQKLFLVDERELKFCGRALFRRRVANPRFIQFMKLEEVMAANFRCDEVATLRLIHCHIIWRIALAQDRA